MNSKKSLLLAAVSCALLSSAFMTSFAKSAKNKNNVSALTGNWACSYTEPNTGFISAGNVTYSGGGVSKANRTGTEVGGIYVCDMDINNQRPLPGFPEGAHVTVLTGTWSQIDTCRFEVVASAVVLTLQPDPTDPTIRTWQPFARIKDVGTITLNGNTLTGSRTVSWFDYFDITLTKRLPIPDLTQSLVAQRVTK